MPPPRRISPGAIEAGPSPQLIDEGIRYGILRVSARQAPADRSRFPRRTPGGGFDETSRLLDGSVVGAGDGPGLGRRGGLRDAGAGGGAGGGDGGGGPRPAGDG